MSFAFFENNDSSFKLELISDNSKAIDDVDDVLCLLKTKCREINEKIQELEDMMTLESDVEAAVLIRQSQYIEALLSKNKFELEKIFFPNGRGNCIIPDVFQWYQEPKSS